MTEIEWLNSLPTMYLCQKMFVGEKGEQVQNPNALVLRDWCIEHDTWLPDIPIDMGQLVPNSIRYWYDVIAHSTFDKVILKVFSFLQERNKNEKKAGGEEYYQSQYDWTVNMITFEYEVDFWNVYGREDGGMADIQAKAAHYHALWVMTRYYNLKNPTFVDVENAFRACPLKEAFGMIALGKMAGMVTTNLVTDEMVAAHRGAWKERFRATHLYRKL